MDIDELLESKQKYECMYWKKFHECNKLKQLLKDNGLGFHLDDFYSNEDKYSGTIIKLSQNLDYGFIKSDINSNLFFHISECKNFELDSSILNKEVNFTLNRKMDKIQACDIYVKQDNPNIQDNINIDNGNIDYLDILNDYNSVPSLTTTIIEHTPNDEYLDFIKNAPNIWYMNAHENSMKYWKLTVKSGFVITGNGGNRNRSVFHKLNNDDIIAWYVRGKGYIAILKVIHDPCKITDKDLDDITCKQNQYSEEDRNWWKEYGIKIPVKFLSHVSPPKFINDKDIPSIKKWTYGLHGPHCMKPNNSEWENQVIEMYKYMKDY